MGCCCAKGLTTIQLWRIFSFVYDASRSMPKSIYHSIRPTKMIEMYSQNLIQLKYYLFDDFSKLIDYRITENRFSLELKKMVMNVCKWWIFSRRGYVRFSWLWCWLCKHFVYNMLWKVSWDGEILTNDPDDLTVRTKNQTCTVCFCLHIYYPSYSQWHYTEVCRISIDIEIFFWCTRKVKAVHYILYPDKKLKKYGLPNGKWFEKQSPSDWNYQFSMSYIIMSNSEFHTGWSCELLRLR